MNPRRSSKNSASKSYWLYLYPYVYVSVKQDRAIIYNTLNGKLLDYRGNVKIVRIIKQLDEDPHLYVIKLKEADIDAHVKQFIESIREFYMGDMIDTSYRPVKPIQLKPILNLQRTFDLLMASGLKSKLLVNDEVKDYLGIITLYILDKCNKSCLMCKTAYKQFLCCFKKKRAKTEISPDDVKKILSDIKNSELYKINLVGGNIFTHTNLGEIIKTLNLSPVLKEYTTHYLNIEDKPEYFELMQSGNNCLNIIVHFPLDKNVFNRCMDILNRYEIRKKFCLVIETEEDISKSEEVASDFHLHDIDRVPFYNRDNLHFFRENVYLDKEAIIEPKPSMNQVLARTIFNTLDFKALTILSNKNVYGNLNRPPIGKWDDKDGHILHMVYKELHKGKSWTKVRKNVAPCKSCVFNSLCPPISNYEYVFGRYNLCHEKAAAWPS